MVLRRTRNGLGRMHEGYDATHQVTNSVKQRSSKFEMGYSILERRLYYTEVCMSCAENVTALLKSHRYQIYWSAATRTPFSSSILESSPFWCIDIKISHPPTNSLSKYSCGIVGQSEYSLTPTNSQHGTSQRSSIGTYS